jgi:hypothetical protein
MPSNTDYLSKLATYNEFHGITATFSEMKKTARRMQKHHESMPEGWRLTVEDYFRQVSDPTGEEATDNVMNEQAAKNATNAARRLAA